jgi:hypothetical protein
MTVNDCKNSAHPIDSQGGYTVTNVLVEIIYSGFNNVQKKKKRPSN